MDTITIPSTRTRTIGRSESIPHWGWASRTMLGALTFAMPTAALVLGLYALTLPPMSLAPEAYVPLLGAVLIMGGCHVLLHVLYIAFAAENPRTRSAPWLIAILLAGPIAIPIYFIIHVWNAPVLGGGKRDLYTPGRRAPQRLLRPAVA